MKLYEIAERLGCKLEGDPEIEISAVATIEEASNGELTFLSNPKYSKKFAATRASAAIVDENFSSPIKIALLRHRNPYLAFARAIELFYNPAPIEPGIHPTAVVDPTARIGTNCSIGAHVVIGRDVQIGDHSVIYPNCTIYPGARIGSHVTIHSNCTVREYVVIGDRCILQNNVVIGGDGFGYAKQDDGSWYKIVQSGTVVLEEDVEVGSGSTIDRATVGETRIKRGAKIDNLVMIGHACVVGENSLLCGQVGLAGSSKIGKNVTLAGQVGVAGHLTVGDNVVATAQTGIPNSIEAGRTVSGYPAMDNRLWLKASTIFQKLPEMYKELGELRRRFAELEKFFNNLQTGENAREVR